MTMRVYHFTEQPYPAAWNDHDGSLRVNLPNRKCDPDDRGRSLPSLSTTNGCSPTSSASTSCSTSIIRPRPACRRRWWSALSVLARQTKRARLLVLGYPIGHRPDPLRVAEELATIDVISRGRLEMGFVKGVPYEFPCSNQNPVGVMDKFWEAHDFIIKAMTSHDGPFNWEGQFFHYRHVNIWPRPWQQPHPPIWSTTGSPGNARMLGERGYVMAVLGSGYKTRPLYDAYREGYMSQGRPAPAPDRFAYLGLVAVAANEAEARRRGELVADYLRTGGIVWPPFRNPPGYLSVEENAGILMGRARERTLDPGRPRGRHAQRQHPGPDRCRHPVLRHARPGP